MQRWEYLLLDCFYFGNHLRPRYRNGIELSDWQKQRLPDLVNQLGEQGWELVSITPIPPGNLPAGGELWVFKRPR